jgi:hypothetical protein
MVVLYPIAIPALYAVLLWHHRHSLNPDSTSNVITRCFRAVWSSITAITTNCRAAAANDDQQQQQPQQQQQQQQQQQNAIEPKPESIKFLWSPYREQVFWWEVVECIRRLALTGFLVFILPGTAGQSAVACVFTVILLIVFSIAAPFAVRTDFDNYWLGCVILFLSTILAFILKGNFTATDTTSQRVLPTLLVTLNILLTVSVAVAVAVVARIAYKLSVAALPTRTACAQVGPSVQSQQQQEQQLQQLPGPRH